MPAARIVGGKTDPKDRWQGDSPPSCAVDAKWAKFRTAPVYLCSLRGQNEPWVTRGASEIYDSGGYGPSSGKDGFTVYVGLDETPYGQREPGIAQDGGWFLEWIAIERPAETAEGTWAVDTSSVAWIGVEAPENPFNREKLQES